MSSRAVIACLILAIGVGFALRIHNLDAVPLRGDEAFSAMFWAELPISDSIAQIATIEPHPPLTYVFFHLWNRWMGGIDSSFLLRMFSVFGNLIGIPAIFALSKRLTGKPLIAILTAWMWALHPFEIWHAQDFRNYALWAGLSVTALYFGVLSLQTRTLRHLLLYAIFATITAFTFYSELLTIIALGLYALLIYRHDKQLLKQFFTIQIAIILGVVIVFVILQGSLFGGGGYGGNVETFALTDYFTRIIPTLAMSDTIPQALTDVWIIITAILIISVIINYRKFSQATIFALILGIIPLILLGIISTRISIFHPRYVITTIPAFILLFILTSYTIATYLSPILPLNHTHLTTVIFLPWIALSALSIANYFNNPALNKSHAWDELGDFLNANVTENDLVIQLSTDAAFGYYYAGSARDIGLPEHPNQPNPDIIKTLEEASQQYDSLYIVANAISDWQNADTVEDWATANMQLVRYSNASGLGIRQYKNWEIDFSDNTPPIAVFKDTVALIDIEIFDKPLPTGEIVVWLYWQPLASTQTPLKSFIHLVGNLNPETGSPLWAQDDQFPQDGRLDSASWVSDEVYRDVYYLSVDDLPEGDYQLFAGWYDPQTNTRVNTVNGDDAYMIGEITHNKKGTLN